MIRESSLTLAMLAVCSNATQAEPLPKSKSSDKSKPLNVVYIIADDLGYGDLGCYGSTKIETPNIDRLAEQGMRFTQHYAGCTVSAPSRSSLMTGHHTGHGYIRGNYEISPEGQAPLDGEAYTLAEMFQDNGYITGGFGKWGLGYPGSEGDPNNQGFDEFFGYNCQREAHRYYPTHLWHNDKKVMLEGNDTKSMSIYAPDLIHEKSLDFIRQNSDKPFFAYLAFVQPHSELIVPEDDIIAKYRTQIIEEKPYINNQKGANYGDPDFNTPAYSSQKEPRATFAAMVERVDRYVGDVVATLEQLGLADNTIIFFTSDNGAHREGGGDPVYFNGNGPFRGYKQDLTDGGIRVPMIVRWDDKVQAGSTSDHICAAWDIMPTMTDLIDAPTPEDIDGISMKAELEGKRQKEHEFLFWEFNALDGRMAIRMGDWKAVRYGLNKDANAHTQLYNIVDDPEELNDLSSQYPKLVKKALKIMSEEHVKSERFPFGYEK